MEQIDFYAGAGVNFSEEQKKKYAKDFAEGSEELEKLLLSLWNQGIDTIACCTGHQEEDGFSNPHVVISIKGMDDRRLKFILTKIYELKRKNIITDIEVAVELYGDETLERHFVTVRFAKIDENNFKLLNEIFDAKDLKVKPAFSLRDRKFIKGAIEMNSLDLVAYAQANPASEQSYSSVSIEDCEEFDGQIGLRTAGRVEWKKVKYNNQTVIVVPGYVSKIEATGEYVVVKDDKVVSITEAEAKKLPLLNVEQMRNKYYCLKKFKLSEFERDVIEEIKEATTKTEDLTSSC